jgi:DNA primase
MIPPAYIQQLLDRADIVDLVGREIKLKKAGVNLLGLCPFHHEKTPSFTVNPAKQFYHCFGCGAHGTALGWVMNRHHLEFIPAVHQLAEWLGMTVPASIGFVSAARHDDLYQVLELATRYFQQQLADTSATAKEVRDYLQARNINTDTLSRFRLGYAPGHALNSKQLRQALKTQGVDDELTLIRAGLVIERERGDHSERFRHRLMVPIQNRKGQVIGFGGRTLGKDEPKYLNSPETEIFHKGKEWFGLPQAMAAIRAENMAIVVEGYFDAMALSQAGLAPVVASMGTAMTEAQIATMWSLTSHLVLCFDGDVAGTKATWRAVDRLLPSLQDGKTVRIVSLPNNMDPDDFVREKGLDATRQFLLAGKTLSTLLMDDLQLHFDGSSEGKAALVRKASVWINSIAADRAPIFRQDLMLRISRLVDLPMESILGALPITQAQSRYRSSDATAYSPRGRNIRSSTPSMIRRSPPSLEKMSLLEALNHPEHIHGLLAGVDASDSPYRQCLQWIADRFDEGEWPESWAARIQTLEMAGYAEQVAALTEKMAREEYLPPQEEDLTFRRDKISTLQAREQQRARYLALCQKHREGTMNAEERMELTQLIPKMPSMHLGDPK